MPSSTPLDRSRTVGRCASDCPLHSEARGAGRALRRRDRFYRPLLRATLHTYLPALPAKHRRTGFGIATLSAICVRSGWGRRTGSCKPPTPPPVRRSQPSPAAGAGPAQRALLPLITGSTGKRLASHCAPDEVDAGEMAGHLPPEPGLRRGRGGDRADRSHRRARRGGVLGGDEVGFAGQRRVPGMPGDDPHLSVREGPCRRPRPTSWR